MEHNLLGRATNFYMTGNDVIDENVMGNLWYIWQSLGCFHNISSLDSKEYCL